MKLDEVLGRWVGPDGLEVRVRPDGVSLSFRGGHPRSLSGATVTTTGDGLRMAGEVSGEDVTVRLRRIDARRIELSWVDPIGPPGTFVLTRPDETGA